VRETVQNIYMIIFTGLFVCKICGHQPVSPKRQSYLEYCRIADFKLRPNCVIFMGLLSAKIFLKFVFFLCLKFSYECRSILLLYYFLFFCMGEFYGFGIEITETQNTKVYGFRYFKIFVCIFIFCYRTTEYCPESILCKLKFYKICVFLFFAFKSYYIVLNTTFVYYVSV